MIFNNSGPLGDLHLPEISGLRQVLRKRKHFSALLIDFSDDKRYEVQVDEGEYVVDFGRWFLGKVKSPWSICLYAPRANILRCFLTLERISGSARRIQ